MGLFDFVKEAGEGLLGGSWNGRAQDPDDDETGFEQRLSRDPSLRDRLLEQLQMDLHHPTDRIIGLHLIDQLLLVVADQQRVGCAEVACLFQTIGVNIASDHPLGPVTPGHSDRGHAEHPCALNPDGFPLATSPHPQGGRHGRRGTVGRTSDRVRHAVRHAEDRGTGGQMTVFG